jgi:F-type H+-transporting ATPase subunit a
MVRFYQFINSLITSAGEATGGMACGEDSMYEVVVGHVTDSPFIYNLHPHGVWDLIGNIIFKLNTFLGFQIPKDPGFVCMHGHPYEVVQSDPVLFFGMADLRITKWVLMLWLAFFLCAVIFIPLARKIKKAPMGSKSKWVNMWEALIGFVHDDVVDPNFGHGQSKKAMPYFLSVFFFIFIANYLGQIPGLATSTGNLAVTAGLACFTLLGMIVIGFIMQGPLWIITGIVPGGIPVFLFPLLWVIELLGLVIKPFALTIRLFANMTAGHVVIIIFIYLVMMFQNYFVGLGSVALSVVIYLLELLVCFIQAYIFTTLSAMFIGASVHAH